MKDLYLKIALVFLLACAANFVAGSPVAAQTQEAEAESLQTQPFSNPPIITSLVITGNRHTKHHIILREIQVKVGDVLDPEVLEADRKRLLNLRLFSNVEIEGIPVEDGVQLIITVYESWYIYPYPIFFMNDRDWDKLSYGAGLLHYNFRGRRETLALSGWAGYNPSLQLDYGNPWMFGNANIFGRWRFYTQTVRNRFLSNAFQEVNEKRWGGNFTLGKRFGLFTFFSVTVGYSSLRFTPESVRDPVDNEVIDLSGRDNRGSLVASFLYDARDFYEYPRAGTYALFWGKRVGLTTNYTPYWRYGFDLRRYQKIYKGLALGARGMADLSPSDVPLDDLVNFGYRNRIRGHFYRRLHGDNLAQAGLELRVPIIPLRYHRLDQSPLFQDTMFGRYFKTVKFGVSAGLFADYGVIWNHGEGFHPENGRSGFGAGLHIHMPYLNVLRLEGAFNEDGKLEGSVDVGVAF